MPRLGLVAVLALAACHPALRPPKRVSGPDPVFTPAAIAAHASGTLVVRCVVTVDGRVKDCRVVEGSIPEMDAQVVRALEQRVYEPATLDGKPVEVNYNFRITLRAQ